MVTETGQCHERNRYTGTGRESGVGWSLVGWLVYIFRGRGGGGMEREEKRRTTDFCLYCIFGVRGWLVGWLIFDRVFFFRHLFPFFYGDSACHLLVILVAVYFLHELPTDIHPEPTFPPQK